MNAIKEAKKLNKLCSSVPVLGKARSSAKSNNTMNFRSDKLEKPTIKKKPSFGKRDGQKGTSSPMLPRFGGKKLFGKTTS